MIDDYYDETLSVGRDLDAYYEAFHRDYVEDDYYDRDIDDDVYEETLYDD